MSVLCIVNVLPDVKLAFQLCLKLQCVTILLQCCQRVQVIILSKVLPSQVKLYMMALVRHTAPFWPMVVGI